MNKQQDRVVRVSDFSKLKPEVVNPRTQTKVWPHRCEAIRECDYANDFIEGMKSLEWLRCHLPAKFKVGAYKVCVRHAGILALDKVLEVKSEMIFWPEANTLEKLKERLVRR